jgi:hypothetical protein
MLKRLCPSSLGSQEQLFTWINEKCNLFKMPIFVIPVTGQSMGICLIWQSLSNNLYFGE